VVFVDVFVALVEVVVISLASVAVVCAVVKSWNTVIYTLSLL